MLPWAWNTIYRNRKRLVFVTTLAFLAGVIFYLRASATVHGLPIPLVTGFIYAATVLVASILVCLFLPRLRFMIEAVAVSRLMLALFVFAMPDPGYSILASPELTALIVVLGGILVSRAIHGRILKDRADGWRARVMPGNLRDGGPARLRATPLQHRIVHWLDDHAPVPA